MNPRIIDNDENEISASLDDTTIRTWSYTNESERRQKMLRAREYVEGWFDCRRREESELKLLEEKLACANTFGLVLLYDIRRELGWNDKTALSILPSGVRRVRHALQTWDTPTGMELEALALAVKTRVIELERINSESNARIIDLLEERDA